MNYTPRWGIVPHGKTPLALIVNTKNHSQTNRRLTAERLYPSSPFHLRSPHAFIDAHSMPEDPLQPPPPGPRAAANRRHCFIVEVKEEHLADYKRHHDNIWPEVTARQ